jgi:transcription initiation factor IIF auxiliary subunit
MFPRKGRLLNLWPKGVRRNEGKTMKELEDYLQLVCQMIEDENSNFHSFLQKLKKKSEWLNLPYGLLQKKEESTWEEEGRL